MNEDFVGYDLAVKLKEKGFNEPCNMYYHIYDDIADCVSSLESTRFGACCFHNSNNKYRCAAPTISQVLKWLRKHKKIHIDIGIWDCKYVPLIVYIGVLDENIVHANKTVDVDDFRLFDTYEQAALAGVNYCLDNLI